MVATSLIETSTTQNYMSQKFSELENEEDLNGYGYSSDSQQIVSQPCYNVSVSYMDGQRTTTKLEAAVSFTVLQRELNIDVTTKGKVGMFSPDPGAVYLRSIQDTDSSFSLNYYFLIENMVLLTPLGFGTAALLLYGSSFYGTGTNNFFNVLCGDQFISSYSRGSLLIFSINIDFKTSYEKELYQCNFAGTYNQNIYNALIEIMNIAMQIPVQGSVSVQAFQKGANPDQLSGILPKNFNEDSYKLSCDLKDMERCVDIASLLLDYARNVFGAQSSSSVLLGASFITVQPISSIGLSPSESLVTPQIVENRLELATYQEENQYYKQRLTSLITAYPVMWDTESSMYRVAEKLLLQAKNNLAFLMESRPHYGANSCFEFPETCESFIVQARSMLEPMSPSSLKELDGLKYYYEFSDGSDKPVAVYKGGDGNTSWRVAGGANVHVVYFVVTPTILNSEYNYCTNTSCALLTINCNATEKEISYLCSATLTDAMMQPKSLKNIHATRRISALFFGPYVSSNNSMVSPDACDRQVPQPMPAQAPDSGYVPTSTPLLVDTVPVPKMESIELFQPVPDLSPQPEAVPSYRPNPIAAPIDAHDPAPITRPQISPIAPSSVPASVMLPVNISAEPAEGVVVPSWDFNGLYGLLGIVPVVAIISFVSYKIYQCCTKPKVVSAIGAIDFSGIASPAATTLQPAEQLQVIGDVTSPGP